MVAAIAATTATIVVADGQATWEPGTAAAVEAGYKVIGGLARVIIHGSQLDTSKFFPPLGEQTYSLVSSPNRSNAVKLTYRGGHDDLMVSNGTISAGASPERHFPLERAGNLSPRRHCWQRNRQPNANPPRARGAQITGQVFFLIADFATNHPGTTCT